MTTFAHLSDLHFGRLHGEAADALLGDLWTKNPDLIVVSGDLTQTAGGREFEAAREYLRQMPKHPVVVPGNHDLPAWNLVERFTAPTWRFRRYIEPERFPLQETEDVVVLGINSTRPHGWYWDWGRGRINLTQIGHIRRVFARRLESKLCVVAAHHPFLRPPQEKRHLVHGPRDLMRLLADCGVDLLLAGHFHKVHTELAATRHPSTPRIVVAQASTSTSYRFRAEPNAYNWFEYDRGRLHVVVHTWQDGQFAAASEKTYVNWHGHWEHETPKARETHGT